MSKQKLAACTIVSKNYFAYAKTLYQSFISNHPNAHFFVLLVDENNRDIDIAQEPFEVIKVSELEIDDFLNVAFKFDVLELNTNVKPTFLKHLMQKYGVSKLVYLDPDILIYQPLTMVFELLDNNDIVLTPHCNDPINDNLRPSEQDYLVNGVFNLGFVGVKNDGESLRFLDWWESRCLSLGFSETRTGLFVDQKWINLAPCFFDRVYILRNPGFNMAYWNLHERILEKKNDQWIVNGYPLVFYHFSGLDIEDEQQISKHQNRYDLNCRSDLKDIFKEYRSLLAHNNHHYFTQLVYSYGQFSNAEPITHIARRLFAANQDMVHNDDPFSAIGPVYSWCKRNRLLGGKDQYGKYNSMTYNANDARVTLINYCLKSALKILGSNRYTMLMKYLSYISILRNQKFIFR